MTRLGDEPTGNLDEDTRNDIITLLEQPWRDCGLTLVLITHDTRRRATGPARRGSCQGPPVHPAGTSHPPDSHL